MKHKMIVTKSLFFILLIFTSFVLSGCIGKYNPNEKNLGLPYKLYPYVKINAPYQKYFGEIIEFDATGSYDPYGKIVSYSWDFGDNEFAEGAIVKHAYKFENNYTINYPLIYSVNLFVKNNKGSITVTSHQIKLYPQKYVFYLNSNKLTIEKPQLGKDNIKCSGLFKFISNYFVTYTLDKPVSIKKCNWNATLYLKKPLCMVANKIKISLFNNEGHEMIEKEEMIGLISLWKEKKIDIKGVFDKEEELKSIKISVYGFSVRNKLFILYGGEKSSSISFNF